jgi:hypothetical protein
MFMLLCVLTWSGHMIAAGMKEAAGSGSAFSSRGSFFKFKIISR